jgi:DNA-binding beta-propeller fold protein YncE
MSDMSDPNDDINQDSTGLVFGPDGNLYINSHKTDSVLRFNGKTGAPMGVFASGPELQQPSGLVFGPDGNLYVASHGPNPVLRYDGSTGTLIDIFVPTGAGQIRNPTALKFGRDGNLYVDSRGNSRVLRFDRKGGFSGTLVPQGTGGLNAPNSILFR